MLRTDGSEAKHCPYQKLSPRSADSDSQQDEAEMGWKGPHGVVVNKSPPGLRRCAAAHHTLRQSVPNLAISSRNRKKGAGLPGKGCLNPNFCMGNLLALWKIELLHYLNRE